MLLPPPTWWGSASSSEPSSTSSSRCWEPMARSTRQAGPVQDHLHHRRRAVHRGRHRGRAAGAVQLGVQQRRHGLVPSDLRRPGHQDLEPRRLRRLGAKGPSESKAAPLEGAAFCMRAARRGLPGEPAKPSLEAVAASKAEQEQVVLQKVLERRQNLRLAALRVVQADGDGHGLVEGKRPDDRAWEQFA